MMSDETKQAETKMQLNEPERISLLDTEWQKQKSAGMTLKRNIRDYIVDAINGDEKVVIVEIEIRVLGGTEQARMHDILMQRGEDGEFLKADTGAFIPKEDPDGSMGETAVVAVSTGLSLQQVDEIRRNKSQRFWTALFIECHKYNGISLAEVEAEKNSDGSAHSVDS